MYEEPPFRRTPRRTSEEVLTQLNLGFKMQPLQIEDAENLATYGRFGLFSDVGCGKTVVSTLAAEMLSPDHIIVVCPPILVDDWYRWLTSIKVPRPVQIYRGARRSTAKLLPGYIIMSHAIFRTDADALSGIVLEAYVIFDEAQALKNVSSKTYQATKRFLGNDHGCALLTATPTTRPEDCFSYISLKTPTLYRGWGHFKGMHIADEDQYGKPTEYTNLDILESNFHFAAQRRTKQDIFGENLTPIFKPIQYKMAKQHAALYKELAEQQMLMLEDGGKIDATTPQALRVKLQQIVCNWDVFSGESKNRASVYDLLDQVNEEVQPENHANSKLVIWVWYRMTARAVTNYLSQKFGQEKVVAAYGDSNARKAVDAIMTDDNVRWLVAHPKSVGAGLNLQHVCSEMLFLETSTVPLDTRQSIGRVDRPGQKRTPTIRFAIAENTVQVGLFKDLLRNDGQVSKIERTPTSLRNMIYGED